MSVTFGASNNATPASGTVVATCIINSENYQLAILAGVDGQPLGGATSPFHVALTNSPSVIVSSGSLIVTNALSASISNTVAVSQSGAWTVTAGNAAGSAAGSPLFVAEVRSAGSAAGSPLFVLATNATGSAVGTPTFSSLTNIGGSAAGSPLFVSACLTNLAGSAAGSPLFASITNLVGSAAGSPIFSSITNLAGSAAGSPLFTRLSDGADTAFVDAASRLAVALTDGTNAYGLPGSPLSNTGEATKLWWGGSLLTLAQANVFAASSACTAIVASLTGFSTVIVAATFTTSSCQFIGWTACGNNGGASATVQSAMPFGTNGGMDANRLPHGYLWQFPSGSIAVLTTTSACIVAGTINYIRVAS